MEVDEESVVEESAAHGLKLHPGIVQGIINIKSQEAQHTGKLKTDRKRQWDEGEVVIDGGQKKQRAMLHGEEVIHEVIDAVKAGLHGQLRQDK